MTAPVVWEVFCCSGGMAEGLRRAGLPVTHAFDHDTDACNSYEANLGHRPVQIDARDLLRLVHPINRADAPSFTVTAKGDCRGAQGACVLEWPWDRPATTVTTREALPPPGHHEASMLSMPDAVKLSERAGAILQGFPPAWRFVAKTKRARWSMIGMAMPPPLAEVVGRSILRQMLAAREVAA